MLDASGKLRCFPRVAQEYVVSPCRFGESITAGNMCVFPRGGLEQMEARMVGTQDPCFRKPGESADLCYGFSPNLHLLGF